LLRVLHVYRTFFPDSQGGLEETIRQICVASREHGIECRVFALSRTGASNPVIVSGIEVYRAPMDLEIASCSISLRCWRLLRDMYRWADIIHYHFPWPFADVLHLMSGHQKPTVLTYHSDIVRQRILKVLYRPLMHRFLDSVDRIVCTSPNYFATSDTLSHYRDKVDVIPIGLDEDTYPQVGPEQIRRIKRRYGSDFYLFVGVLRYYKGLHILLDAVEGAPYSIVIAGSGPTERKLREQAANLGLRNVRFAGQVSDLTKVAMLSLCRAIVFPSYLRSEAFGVTLLEGAMFGKPLISTEVGSGTSHVNVDKETGYVVRPGCTSSLRSALDKLHGDPQLAKAMGSNARLRYKTLFTARHMGAKYAALYNDLAANQTQRLLVASEQVNDTSQTGRS
jgi:rhamnosyl/mannosyltransferase